MFIGGGLNSDLGIPGLAWYHTKLIEVGLKNGHVVREIDNGLFQDVNSINTSRYRNHVYLKGRFVSYDVNSNSMIIETNNGAHLEVRLLLPPEVVTVIDFDNNGNDIPLYSRTGGVGIEVGTKLRVILEDTDTILTASYIMLDN